MICIETGKRRVASGRKASIQDRRLSPRVRLVIEAKMAGGGARARVGREALERFDEGTADGRDWGARGT